MVLDDRDKSDASNGLELVLVLFELRRFCDRSFSKSAVFDRITSPPILVILADTFGSVESIGRDWNMPLVLVLADDGGIATARSMVLVNGLSLVLHSMVRLAISLSLYELCVADCVDDENVRVGGGGGG